MDLFGYASKLEELGQVDRAIVEYTDLLDACLGGGEPLIRRSRLLRQLGRDSEAEADLKHAPIQQAIEFENAGQPDRAIAEYNKLLDACSAGIEPLIRRSELFQRIGRVSEAEKDFRHAAKIYQNDGRPFLGLARLASENERQWLAAHYIEAAMGLQPEVAEFRIVGAMIFLPLGWFDRALAVVRYLPSNLPDHWKGVKNFAEKEYRTYRTDALMRCRVYGKHPDPVLGIFELALSLFYVGRLEVAGKLCEAVMRDRPHSFAAFEFYAKIVARRRGAAYAVEFLRAVSFLHGRDPDHVRMMELMSRQMEQL